MEPEPVPGPLARILLMVLLAVPVVGHVVEIPQRGIDPDEFEHLHAAYQVWLGDVPYRDFFEHHGPGLYYLAWPLFAVFGPDLSVLWAGRGVCFALSLAALWLTGRIASRMGGIETGLIAAGLLGWSTVFHTKAIEFRPDGPALVLLLASASLIWRFPFRIRNAALAGALAGLATLFTQKSVVPASGIWLAWLVGSFLDDADRQVSVSPLEAAPGRTGTRISGTITFALCGALPWAIVAGLFAAVSAAGDLWRGAVVQLWSWPLRISPFDHLRPVVAADVVLWFAASWEVTEMAMAAAVLRRASSRGAIMAAIVAAWCLASLLWIKAAYPQYYLLWTPMLAILAGRRLLRWAQGEAGLGFILTAGVLGLGLALHQFSMWNQALIKAGEGALPNLSFSMPQAAVPAEWALLLLFAAVLYSSSHGLRGRAVAFLVLLGSFYGLLRVLDAHIWPNTAQVANVEFVHAHVPPDGRILDGFSGYGALRRHAFYYWWLNDHSRPLVGDRLVPLLMEALERQPPAGILLDRNLQSLPDPVLRWIHDHYVESEWGLLLVPKK